MRLLISTIFSALFAATTAHAETISTLGSEAGTITDALTNLVFGQTFTLDSAGTFDAWTFRADDGGVVTNYSVLLYGWDGVNTTVAPQLYGSAGVTSGVAGIQTLSDTGNGALLAAGQYALFLLETGGAFSDYATRDALAPDYTGGSLIVQNDIGFNPTGTWSVFENIDLSFSVEIGPTPIPLPAAGPLMLCSFALLGGLRRARRKRRLS